MEAGTFFDCRQRKSTAFAVLLYGVNEGGRTLDLQGHNLAL